MRKTVLAVTALLISLPVIASDLETSLAECAQISTDADRLHCYDTLSKNIPDTDAGVSAPLELTDDIGRKRERKKKQEKAAAENYPVIVTDCERGTASKRILFTLDNGQVWRQKNSRWLSLRDCKGSGKIKHGYFGYSLHLDSMNQSVGVIRAD